MKTKELTIGDHLKPVEGMSFHLDTQVWVLPPPDTLASYNVANLVFDREKNVNPELYALYLGRSIDDVKVVGAHTSYNFLISGEVYKVSGYEIRYLEPVCKEQPWKKETNRLLG